MAEYKYTRHLVDGVYDINNPLRVDAEGEQIKLYQEINNHPQFSQKFDINCSGAECTITFESELSGEDEILLGEIVAAHQNNL